MVRNENFLTSTLNTNNQQRTTYRVSGGMEGKTSVLPTFSVNFFVFMYEYKANISTTIWLCLCLASQNQNFWDQTTAEAVEWSATDRNRSELDPCGVKNHRQELSRIESRHFSGVHAVSAVCHALSHLSDCVLVCSLWRLHQQNGRYCPVSMLTVQFLDSFKGISFAPFQTTDVRIRFIVNYHIHFSYHCVSLPKGINITKQGISSCESKEMQPYGNTLVCFAEQKNNKK